LTSFTHQDGRSGTGQSVAVWGGLGGKFFDDPLIDTERFLYKKTTVVIVLKAKQSMRESVGSTPKFINFGEKELCNIGVKKFRVAQSIGPGGP